MPRSSSASCAPATAWRRRCGPTTSPESCSRCSGWPRPRPRGACRSTPTPSRRRPRCRSPWPRRPPTSIALSAHKLGGPKGVGCLLVRDAGAHAATDVGWGTGARAALRHRERAGSGRVCRGARGHPSRGGLTGSPAHRLEEALRGQHHGGLAPELRGCRVTSWRSSRASAPTCSCSRSTAPAMPSRRARPAPRGDAEPSHVLIAQGMSPQDARSVVRVSLGLAHDGGRGRRLHHGVPRLCRAVAGRCAARDRGRGLIARVLRRHRRARPVAASRRLGRPRCRRWRGREQRLRRRDPDRARGWRAATSPWRGTARSAARTATAAAELACALAEGRSLLDAARIGMLRPRGGARAARSAIATASLLAVDALHAALATALHAASLPVAEGRVAVAMSGGVDSAVTLLKAVEAGLEPVGRHPAAVDRPRCA